LDWENKQKTTVLTTNFNTKWYKTSQTLNTHNASCTQNKQQKGLALGKTKNRLSQRP
jgi:hypothetical protein